MRTAVEMAVSPSHEVIREDASDQNALSGAPRGDSHVTCCDRSRREGIPSLRSGSGRPDLARRQDRHAPPATVLASSGSQSCDRNDNNAQASPKRDPRRCAGRWCKRRGTYDDSAPPTRSASGLRRSNNVAASSSRQLRWPANLLVCCSQCGETGPATSLATNEGRKRRPSWSFERGVSNSSGPRGRQGAEQRPSRDGECGARGSGAKAASPATLCLRLHPVYGLPPMRLERG